MLAPQLRGHEVAGGQDHGYAGKLTAALAQALAEPGTQASLSCAASSSRRRSL
ncbi:MAG TPA: hypothetical protein VEM58_05590 [Streptosporangiaceae bacterium]|nr:hypothetical protein [Streptosporangiaceae bacterium]